VRRGWSVSVKRPALVEIIDGKQGELELILHMIIKDTAYFYCGPVWSNENDLDNGEQLEIPF